jgi:hypothetical protein
MAVSRGERGDRSEGADISWHIFITYCTSSPHIIIISVVIIIIISDVTFVNFISESANSGIKITILN